MDQINCLRKAEINPFQGTTQKLTSKQLEEMNKKRMARKRFVLIGWLIVIDDF